MSISALSRELAAKGIKMHRLELTGYLKALANMNVLRERDIKPSKVFSPSTSRDKSIHEMVGDACAARSRSADEHATLVAYCLQRLLRRPVFDMEVRRCGVEGIVEGRKVSPEERSEAKVTLTRLSYKVPNSDTPVYVEKDLEDLYLQVLADIIVERYNLGPFMKATTQTKL